MEGGRARQGRRAEGPAQSECTTTTTTMIIKCQKMPTVRESEPKSEPNYGKGKTKTVMFRMFHLVSLSFLYMYACVCLCVCECVCVALKVKTCKKSFIEMLRPRTAAAADATNMAYKLRIRNFN